MTNTDAKIMREAGNWFKPDACHEGGECLCECDECQIAFKQSIARQVRAYFQKDASDD